MSANAGAFLPISMLFTFTPCLAQEVTSCARQGVKVNSIEMGKKAPAFALMDQDGKQVSLADLKGQWVVLYFYPRDDTPGCTTEACEFTAGIKDFQGLEATVVGCSPD